MATKNTGTAGQKKSAAPAVIGRSAVTGRFVFKPATKKGATITVKQANSAIESVRANAKK